MPVLYYYAYVVYTRTLAVLVSRWEISKTSRTPLKVMRDFSTITDVRFYVFYEFFFFEMRVHRVVTYVILYCVNTPIRKPLKKKRRLEVSKKKTIRKHYNFMQIMNKLKKKKTLHCTSLIG